jgi:hypothetical protein
MLLKKRLSPRGPAGAARGCRPGRRLRVMFADEARFGRMNRSRRAGPAGHPAASGLPAHSRIHLFVRCGLSVGWDLRLFDYADLEHDLFPSFLNVLSRRFVRQEILLVLDVPGHGKKYHFLN